MGGVQVANALKPSTCFNFVLTDAYGNRYYCGVVLFFEEVIFAKQTKYIQKAICLVSTMPYFELTAFYLKEILSFIRTGEYHAVYNSIYTLFHVPCMTVRFVLHFFGRVNFEQSISF